jgi:hypothetical protein
LTAKLLAQCATQELEYEIFKLWPRRLLELITNSDNGNRQAKATIEASGTGVNDSLGTA